MTDPAPPSELPVHRGLLGKRLLILGIFSILSGFVGHLYGNVFYWSDENDYFMGFRCGFTIGLISTAIEIFYIRSRRQTWIRRVAFLPGLIVRIVVLTLIIRVSLTGNQLLTTWLTNGDIPFELDLPLQVRDTLFSMAIVIVFVIFSQLTSIIGGRRFLNLVFGRYFRPVTEDRAFVFLDLVGSTALARRLGNERFHEYLSECFYQVDQFIVRSGGEIVSYVGDAAIITWPLGDDPKRNAKCLRAVQEIVEHLDNTRNRFDTVFGEVPTFRSAMHGGPVVVGECGDSRRQVTFLGDAVNVTARIEAVAKEEDERCLISDDLLSRLDVPSDLIVEPVGTRTLRGVAEPCHLNRIVFPSLPDPRPAI